MCCIIITPAKHGYLQVPASTALMAYERKNKCYNLMCSFNLSRIPTFHFLFQSRFICAYNQVFFVFCFFSSILESFRKSTKKSNPKRCKQIGLCFFLLPNSLFSDWFCFQWKNLMTKRMVLHENLIGTESDNEIGALIFNNQLFLLLN